MQNIGLKGVLLSCKNQNLSYHIRQKLLTHEINLQIAADYYDLISKFEIIKFDFIIIDTRTIDIMDGLVRLFSTKISRFYVPYIVYVGEDNKKPPTITCEDVFISENEIFENFEELFSNIYLKFKMRNEKRNEVDDNKIIDYLKTSGLSPKHIGFFYIKDGICYVLRKNNTFSLSREVYPRISQKYNTSVCNVEKSIRYAIQIALEENNPFEKRITNKEYFAEAINFLITKSKLI